MPKIVDKTLKRVEIARVSMDLFAQKGFDKTSIREITKQAGIGKGSFYDYFANKEELLIDIALIMFKDWTQIIISKISHINDPMDQLSALLTEGAKLGESFEQMMVLYMDIWRCSVSPKSSEAFNRHFRYFLNETKQAIIEIINAAKQKNMIRQDVEADVLAISLIALIDGLCLHYMILKSDIDIDYVCTVFFETLKQGVA